MVGEAVERLDKMERKIQMRELHRRRYRQLSFAHYIKICFSPFALTRETKQLTVMAKGRLGDIFCAYVNFILWLGGHSYLSSKIRGR